MPFAFENLVVYRRAVAFANRVDVLAIRLKGAVSWSFLDQLTRASMSVALNLAEGTGRWHIKEKKHFFSIARGCVFEMVPILEMARTRGLIAEDDFQKDYRELEELSIMILRLIQATDRLDRHTLANAE